VAEDVEDPPRETLTPEELHDAWPVLDSEERLEGFHLLPREEAVDFFLGLTSRGHATVLQGMAPRERRAWLRLGRDVVGQRTTVAVAKNRYGPPGRSVELDIHYLADGERCVATGRLASDGAARLRPELHAIERHRATPHLVVV
jgi:hypothetical protein